MFGRKRHKSDQEDQNLAEANDIQFSTGQETETSQPEQTETSEANSQTDKWEQLDISRDWRENGPFDISEVDLGADDVERIDLGALIFTPFEGMNFQLQIDPETRKAPAVLVSDDESAIEIALFAAPRDTSLIGEIRQDMIKATQDRGGKVKLAEGPFGTEIRRAIPIGEGKEQQIVESRVWFVGGDRWLLRGVLLGKAASETGVGNASELLYEFFSNVVVVRGNEPKVPSDLIELKVPETIAVG